MTQVETLVDFYDNKDFMKYLTKHNASERTDLGPMMNQILEMYQTEQRHYDKMTANGWYVITINSIVKCSDAMKGGHSNMDWKNRLADAVDWCNTNCTGKHTNMKNHYWFQLETDAFQFKLAH